MSGNRTERVLYATFPPQTIAGARLVITAINNGRWYDDFNNYAFYNKGIVYGCPATNPGSPKRAMVYELEAYGPASQ